MAVETSFPIKGQPLGDEQWGQITRGIGSGIITDDSAQYNISRDNAANTATITNGASKAQAIVQGFYHQINAPVVLPVPAVTAATTYYIGLTYDPTKHSAATGPVSLTCTTSVPSGGGKVYVPLWEIKRSANQLLTNATLIERRAYVSPQISVWSMDALQSTGMLIGTRAYNMANGRNYWLSPNNGWEATNDSVTAAGNGIDGVQPNGKAVIQAGTNAVVSNASGDATVAFPNAFAHGLTSVVITPKGVGSGGARHLVLLESYTDITRFSFRIYDVAGRPIKNFPHNISWMAMGW